MGFFDSITPGVGALGAGLMGFLGGQSTNEANADIARENNAWSAQQFATRYQTTVKDLEAAGLNPMLAYSQGGGSPPTAQQVQFQNPVSSAMDAYTAVRGGESKAAHAYSSASHADALAKQADATTSKIIEETKNVPLEGRKLERTSALLAEELNLVYQKTQSEIRTREVMTATIAKLNGETTLLKNQAAVEQALDNLGRTTKELAPAAKMLLDIFRSMK